MYQKKIFKTRGISTIITEGKRPANTKKKKNNSY